MWRPPNAALSGCRYKTQRHKNVNLSTGATTFLWVAMGDPRCHFFFFSFPVCPWPNLKRFSSLLGCFLSAMSAHGAGFASALTLVPVTFSLILLQGWALIPNILQLTEAEAQLCLAGGLLGKLSGGTSKLRHLHPGRVINPFCYFSPTRLPH